MSTGRRWQDIKAEAHRRNPELADPERRARARAELDAYIAGHHLKELRRAIGKTQAESLRSWGLPVPRLPDRERQPRETLRAYATALGGHLDITVSVGPHSVKVA
jgi:hypothetical protein